MKEGKCRSCLSSFFKCVLFFFSLVALALTAIQIVNIVKNPAWTEFPKACPDFDETGQYCIRVANEKSLNSIEVENLVKSYNLHNGLIAFNNTILDCLAKQNF